MLIYTNLYEKSLGYLLIIYMKNASHEVKTNEILPAHVRYCNLDLCDTKNALVFSQSDARNFFMYIVKMVTTWKLTGRGRTVDGLRLKVVTPCDCASPDPL